MQPPPSTPTNHLCGNRYCRREVKTPKNLGEPVKTKSKFLAFKAVQSRVRKTQAMALGNLRKKPAEREPFPAARQQGFRTLYSTLPLSTASRKRITLPKVVAYIKTGQQDHSQKCAWKRVEAKKLGSSKNFKTGLSWGKK